MTIRIVRLGSARTKDEGIRIGTVRRPPRGVPKTEFASQNWYDVWFPTLAPSVETMKLGQAAETPAQWATFIKKYRAEMSKPEASHALELLAGKSFDFIDEQEGSSQEDWLRLSGADVDGRSFCDVCHHSGVPEDHRPVWGPGDSVCPDRGRPRGAESVSPGRSPGSMSGDCGGVQ